MDENKIELTNNMKEVTHVDLNQKEINKNEWLPIIILLIFKKILF